MSGETGKSLDKAIRNMGLDPSSEGGFYSSLLAHPKADAAMKEFAWGHVTRVVRDAKMFEDWMKASPRKQLVAAAKRFWDYEEAYRKEKGGARAFPVIEPLGKHLGPDADFMVPYLADQFRKWFRGEMTELGGHELPDALDVFIQIAPGGGDETKKVLEAALKFDFGGDRDKQARFRPSIEEALKKFK
jgi:hypothetical protein